MIAVWLVGGAIAGLVVLYLTNPYYERFELSAARFFETTETHSEPMFKLRFKSLLLSHAFYLQLAMLLLLLLALVLTQYRQRVTSEGETIGVWIALDRSASMSTRQGGRTRMELAHDAVDELVAQLRDVEDDAHICLRLATFDLEATLDGQAYTLDQISAAAARVLHSQLGTDLQQVKAIIAKGRASADAVCPLTHLVVLSDRSAPEWLNDLVAGNGDQEEDPIVVVWQTVGEPLPSVGITNITGGGADPFSGGAAVNIELTAYLAPPSTLIITVSDPDGQSILQEPVQWGQTKTHIVSFTPQRSGAYTIELSDDGVYAYDDRVTIVVDTSQQLRVDWRLADRTLPDLFGWQQDSATPHLRVQEYPAEIGDVPTLLVADLYASSAPSFGEIDYFDERSPLLEGASLDVIEQIPAHGLPQPPIGELLPALYGLNNKYLLAASDEPLAAVIPGLPIGVPAPSGNPNLDALSATLFFNAVRFLLQERKPPALYTVTTPEEPLPDGNRLVLHPDEGNTGMVAQGFGAWADIEPVSGVAVDQPIWPYLIAATAMVVTIERGLAAYGGPRWR